ncbi:MAG: hypothetical protein V1663_04295 [archaeon]
METEQFNIRIPSELVYDLEVISKLLKVNKSEWVKLRLAEDVMEEKNRLLIELSNLYVNGIVSKEEIKKLLGEDMSNKMDFIKNKSIISLKKGLDYGKKFKG